MWCWLLRLELGRCLGGCLGRGLVDHRLLLGSLLLLLGVAACCCWAAFCANAATRFPLRRWPYRRRPRYGPSCPSGRDVPFVWVAWFLLLVWVAWLVLLLVERGDGAQDGLAGDPLLGDQLAVGGANRRREPGGPAVLPHDHQRGRVGLQLIGDPEQILFR